MSEWQIFELFAHIVLMGWRNYIQEFLKRTYSKTLLIITIFLKAANIKINLLM